MTLHGTSAYTADWSDGLSIIDVSDPAHPAQVDAYDTPGRAWDVAVAGDYIYIADGNNGLVILHFAATSNNKVFLPSILVED